MIWGTARTWSSKTRGWSAGRDGRATPSRTPAARNPAAAGSTWAADDADDARFLQPANPVQRRGRGQPDEPGQLDVGTVRIRLERGKQSYVNIIKFNCHLAMEYIAKMLSKSRILFGHAVHHGGMPYRSPPRRCRAHRSRTAVGHHRAAVQAGPGVAATGLAGPVSGSPRPPRSCWPWCRARPSAHRAPAPPRVLASGAIGYGGSVLLQNAGLAQHQRDPGSAAGRRHAGAGRGHRRGMAPRDRAAGRLGRVSRCRWPASA